MAGPYYPSGPGLAAFPDGHVIQFYNPSSYPAYPLLLGSGQLPESVAYWHNTQIQQPGMMAPVGDPMSLQQQPAVEQKKHKRTRSGCFTCRARRVKCDEARPTCDRCRKGKRECVYPSPHTKAASRTKSRDRRQTAQESESSDDETGGVRGLDVIPDGDEGPEAATTSSPSTTAESTLSKKRSNTSLARRRPRKESETSLASKTKSESPRSDWTQTSHSSTPSNLQYRGQFVQKPLRDVLSFPEVTRLGEDLRFFLNYHQERINYQHYFLRKESDGFVRETLVDLCLNYEPLLYAVVGFAAYHHTVARSHGKLYDFLKYYDRSLTLLRKSLSSGGPHDESMLATILQLSTFEESIGDWVNLVDHHQAADALMHELLVPENITQSELHRHLFIWHARFDIVAGLLAGSETILGREWYKTIEDVDQQQAALNPTDHELQLRSLHSRNRLFAMDMASLYAKLSSGLISMDEFMTQLARLGHTVEEMYGILKPYDQSEDAIIPNPAVPLLGPDDVLDTDMPCRFYKASLWNLNFAWIDLLATELMFKYQSHLVIKQPEGLELQRLALELCHVAEGIIRWQEVEVGTIIAFHNCLPIMGMFLPRDPKHIMWSRRTIARLETNGYVYAPKVRKGLAEVWGLPELHQWWVPDDDGCPEIIKEIRCLTEERTTNPRDHFREDIRNMKSLFSKISLDEYGSQESSPTSVPVTEPSPAQSSNSGQQ